MHNIDFRANGKIVSVFNAGLNAMRGRSFMKAECTVMGITQGVTIERCIKTIEIHFVLISH